MMETTAREMAGLRPLGWAGEQVMEAWWDWYTGGRLASVGLRKGQGGASGSDVGQMAWIYVISTPGWSEPVEAAFAAEFSGKPFPRLRYPLSDDPHRLRMDFRRKLAIRLLEKPFTPAVTVVSRVEGEELAIAQLERKGLRVETQP